jgi:hypothetical protein
MGYMHGPHVDCQHGYAVPSDTTLLTVAAILTDQVVTTDFDSLTMRVGDLGCTVEKEGTRE